MFFPLICSFSGSDFHFWISHHQSIHFYFTAWSSVRDPSQVFKFLEAVFSSFDELAETHRVFKVESIRDVYVAATGIPRPQKDHAVRMARFASEVMRNMNSLTKELELVYGPDTGSLSLKIVMHSGPVTGGFLKGKGARFQVSTITPTPLPAFSQSLTQSMVNTAS